ncbi:MAG TPA: ADP-ribosylglycohydrolase family protein, partial [Candidatus Hydrogenedentes bacterium]|nr:ADP-ribosylglycohydrolase family protein [Candidatus Hydrogenedentota bacterium]
MKRALPHGVPTHKLGSFRHGDHSIHMAYFTQILKLAEQVSLWADLRHEQGEDISRELKKIERALEASRKSLERWRISDATLSREPNSLQSIRTLRPAGPRRMENPTLRADFVNRMRGAWLGRAAGCTLGVPVEAWSVADMKELATLGSQAFPPKEYWAIHPKQNLVHHKVKRIKD